MADYNFTAFGHRNILAKHKTTLEFTKDSEISKRADCIIGVNSDFDIIDLKKFVFGKRRVRIIICANNEKFEVNAILNEGFNDEREIVVRKTGFVSERTLGINADRAASDVPEKMAKLLQNPQQKIQIQIAEQ